MERKSITLWVNEVEYKVCVESDRFLSSYLRDDLELLGTRTTCGVGECGYCTPGMILAAKGLLLEKPDPDEEEIKHALAGNFCRCTGYGSIVEAVGKASENGRGVTP